MADYTIKDKLKAGLEVTGAVAKTMGKRLIGDDSPTTLSKTTQEIVDAKIPAKPTKKVKP